MLTCTDGLHALDEYLVSELRYIETGRHCKANYRITYEHLKELGLRSLVNEYYKFKAEKRALIYFTYCLEEPIIREDSMTKEEITAGLYGGNSRSEEIVYVCGRIDYVFIVFNRVWKEQGNSRC